MPPRRMTPKIAVHLQTALIAGGLTYDQLVPISGLAKEAVARWVKGMRSYGFVHVENWVDDKRGHPVVPVFRWSARVGTPDRARPGPARTSAERMAASRARRRWQELNESAVHSLEDTLL